MRVRSGVVLIIILIFSFVLSCSHEQSVLKPGKSKADELFTKAKAYYDSGKWGKAVKYFMEFVYSYPYDDKIAEGTFLLADSYFNDGQFQPAIGEFRRVVQRFSESEFAERAEIMIAESYLASSPRVALEQDDTETALETFQDFITYNPKSEYIEQARDGIARCREKLAEKEYRNAEQYFKLRKSDAAILYSDIVIEDYGGTSWVPKAMLLKGRVLNERLGQPEAAEKIYRQIVDNFPGTKEAEEASERLEKTGS